MEEVEQSLKELEAALFFGTFSDSQRTALGDAHGFQLRKADPHLASVIGADQVARIQCLIRSSGIPNSWLAGDLHPKSADLENDSHGSWRLGQSARRQCHP